MTQCGGTGCERRSANMNRQRKARKNDATTAVARQVRALELRRDGLTYELIAQALGYAQPAGAFRAVRRGLLVTLREPAEELRTLELARLDSLQEALWTDAVDGNLSAVDRVLKIMRRRASLLGLDAPKQYRLGHDVSLQEMAREAGTLRGLDADAVLAEAEFLLRRIAAERSER